MCMRGLANWLNYPKHWWTTKFNSNLMTKVNFMGNSLTKIAKCESTKEKICKYKEKPVENKSIKIIDDLYFSLNTLKKQIVNSFILYTSYNTSL